MARHRIIIQNVNLPKKQSVNADIRWVCDSLGLMNGRDVHDTSLRVMNKLLGQFSDNELVATESLSKELRLENPIINHHIRGFMNSGIIFREKRKIAISGGSLTAAIEEMRRESERLFDRLEKVTKRIDKKIGL